MVTLGNGQFLKIMSAGGDDVNKAAFTSRVICITEAARFSEGAETSVEADPFSQLQARQRAYSETERRTYIEGTLTIEEELPWVLRPQSTKSQLLAQCPWSKCKAYMLPSREHLFGWQDARPISKHVNERTLFALFVPARSMTQLVAIVSLQQDHS